ncbi:MULTISPECIES: sporulation-specific diadenylate cyclase CdaS [unclassified Cytobacillus]|uniref:sporulation-specific diadenylate cyclase CdaS n=1 Tax=unclassified Cytobacillus TaxID=2675268 RepID=UPI001358FB3E|nr:sporulation-specific diadenylate cyclase CdaS [Cytobacillus sp. AMY 15.2]KAF0819817.1 Diadenylate cyclase spyDAC [Bacillus sp. ZZV12-4809]MCM3092310.1 sporulation-specific diadenylate cyclase CdaS [Cytobacillus sp. AMY 15.2]
MIYGEEQYRKDLNRYIGSIDDQIHSLSKTLEEFSCCILSDFETLHKTVTEAHAIASTYYLQSYLAPFTKEYSSLSLAAQHLSEKRHGGLIVVERRQPVEEYIHNGTPIGAKVSHTLIETIFYPGNPLHDGGTLIREDTIISAGSILPLTKKSMEGKKLGTRHRAAIGITEKSDAVAIVVSEETGRISFAVDGQIYTIRT